MHVLNLVVLPSDTADDEASVEKALQPVLAPYVRPGWFEAWEVRTIGGNGMLSDVESSVDMTTVDTFLAAGCKLRRKPWERYHKVYALFTPAATTLSIEHGEDEERPNPAFDLEELLRPYRGHKLVAVSGDM